MDVLRWLSLRYNSAAYRIKDFLGWTETPPLREFVYLDETAVISLIASTTGGVTEQQSTLKRSQISSSITGNLSPTGGSPGLKGTVGATHEQSSEVVRKYVIQSNFTELYELREDDLVIPDEDASYDTLSFGSKESEQETAGEIGELDLETEEIERGNLIEIDIELSSHDIYRVYKALDLLYDVFDTIPDWVDVSQEAQGDISLKDMDTLTKMMDEFLRGLVPIVGEAKSYGVVVTEGEAYIGEKSTLDSNNIDYEPLNIVGFVEEDLLWQDSSRFLFSGSEYTAYCRIEGVEVSNEWVPLKLIDVVANIAPDAGKSLRNLPDSFNLDVEEDDSTSATGRSIDEMRLILRDYIRRTTEAIPESVIDNVVEEAIGEIESDDISIDQQEELLKQAILVVENTGYGSSVVSEDRMRSIKTDVLFRERDTEQRQNELSTNGYFLEVNFIAIYW